MEKELYRKAEELVRRIRALEETSKMLFSACHVNPKKEFTLTISLSEQESVANTVILPGFLLTDLFLELRKKTNDYIEKYQNEFSNL